jgi:hypothetical protein
MITPGPLRCPPADETLARLNQPKPRPRLNNKLRTRRDRWRTRVSSADPTGTDRSDAGQLPYNHISCCGRSVAALRLASRLIE